jgi:chromate reductase, NAD(P)H dehydrogenase (quinone)
MSLDEIPLFNADIEQQEVPAKVKELASAIKSSYGIIISTPEYNGTYSGIIKNTLDWLSRDSVATPLEGKPVLILSASPGGFGGAVANEDLRKLAVYLGMYPIPMPRIRISKVNTTLDENGTIIDQPLLAKLKLGVEELFKFSTKIF